MYSPIQLLFKYLWYVVTAKSGRGHGIHSPFVFQLVIEVFKPKKANQPFVIIEKVRAKLLNDNNLVEVNELGAGSRSGTKKHRKIADIARNALKPPKYSQWMFRLMQFLQPNTIVELGTSLGITTAYFASACPKAMVYTLEGVPAIAQIAQQNFMDLQLDNIKLIEGNFDHTLSEVLKALPTLDVAFLDGNHRLAPTISYFEQIWPCLHSNSCVILDDIHWSTEMEQAWHILKKDKRVTCSIDLFFIGVLFFSPNFTVQQHFVIRY